MSKILIIGGTGAQGSAIARALSERTDSQLFVFTRDASSPRAQELLKLKRLTLIEGDSTKIEDLRKAFSGMNACYVNTNGFALGDRDELYWGVKLFELAAEAKIQHYVYAGLPYVYKRSGYDRKYNVEHLDGKGRVVDFITAQPTEPMNWTVVNSCLYLEMLHASHRPTIGMDGRTYEFSAAVGEGSAAMIALPDLALYTLWVFKNPEEARGMVLDTATEHVNWNNLVQAFTDLTGKPAIYKPISPQSFGEEVARNMGGGIEARFGRDGVKIADNFAAFMEVHRLGVNGTQGLWTVDYDRLDVILPARIRSVAEWMKKVNYTGDENIAVLKGV